MVRVPFMELNCHNGMGFRETAGRVYLCVSEELPYISAVKIIPVALVLA